MYTKVDKYVIIISTKGVYELSYFLQLPMFHMGESKRNYGMRDFRDWLDYLSVTDFQFPAAFPHKSLNALRMTIANPDDKLRMAVCKYWHASLQYLVTAFF